MWVRLKEREITDILPVPVFLAVQSVRLRGRTGQTTAHSPSFWGC